ncbi:putative ribosomal protein l19 [Golovinomyces cichoracearum]|uniref:Putative ribosomal protein l19 n=1 Tax=Golovinomyces cichoracearum TaxID=62708 RepID=A0A420HPI5_9PEZI|nr:putative ribosomal protein l19 [Golovinomyces cichoracearum]
MGLSPISDNPGTSQPHQILRAHRQAIRNSTFILASTGEQVRRQITFQNFAKRNLFSFGGAPTNESTLHNTSLPLSQCSDSHPNVLRSAFGSFLVSSRRLGAWLQTPTSKSILKCSLAYLLGSLGTFYPPITRILGQQDGKHLVATVMVYFHPARSAGSMAEAALLGISAIIYAMIVGFSSMAVAVLFESQWGLIEVAHVLILVVFCGGGLGLVGWFKQAYQSPLVSVACSLSSLSIISIITKEAAIRIGSFSYDKIIQVIKMVAIGISTSAIISLVIWPVSARKELRVTMLSVTESAGEMLSLITDGFLTGSENIMRSPEFIDAQGRHKVLFSQMTRYLREAKFEHYILGTEKQYKYESNLVNCLERISQSIGGLRSAATTQFTLLEESLTQVNSAQTESFHESSELYRDTIPVDPPLRNENPVLKRLINEVSEMDCGVKENLNDENLFRPKCSRKTSVFSQDSSLLLPNVRTSSEIFSRFIDLLGPSIKSLAYTLYEILQDFPINEEPDTALQIVLQFKGSLGCALKLFSSSRSKALKELYKGKELNRARPESIEADFEEVAASCGYFSFSLQTFAKEMLIFMEILEELKEESENTYRSWNWIRFWKKSRKSHKPVNEEEELLIAQIPETHISRRRPNLVLNSLANKNQFAFQNTPGLKQKLAYRLVSLMKLLNRDDLRYAIKVGIGASIYALFAYIPATRPVYEHWRGEWGLVSYMLVCSTTIGASNTIGYSRFIGTFIGAVVAVFIWIICQGKAYALAFCGWLISLPCFYIIVGKNQGPFGRFIMLTYNISCLYAYSISIKEGKNDDDEGDIAPIISEIALHRLVAVFSGVIWGMVITRMLWPVSARKKFQDGLSLLWLRMGLIWKRDPLAALFEGDSQAPYMDLREEFALHRYLSILNNLRNVAKNEFELRGPFPAKEFGNAIECTMNMLDSFHAMNDIIQSDLTVTEGERILLIYTAGERAQLCSIISHLYQVLASSLKLEYPINDALPSISKARDSLLAKIFQYRRESVTAEKNEQVVIRDEDYELLYAYILVTGQLAKEIGKLETEITKLYGFLNEDSLRLK